MTQKFNVGDSVQFVYNNEHFVGTIKECPIRKDWYKVLRDDGGTLSILEHSLAPAPALVKVPQFVADYIEDAKKGVYNTLAAAFNCHTKNWDVSSWLQNFDDLDGLDYDKAYKNQELFARAWLDGYTVEKEQLYYVKMPFLTWNEDSVDLETNWAYLQHGARSGETRMAATNKEFPSNDFKSRLSEKTIKAIDERYWAFAVPVEEENKK
ncbi:DUF1642 domain-containing protein [Paenilisteria rocourtiae]|uniref:Uncharacterized protein DUF1642 n=1 Tax=Listeria rocourtiae TaxID=647910 RepID=A0A4R6ZN46_9LIST|nr:DUF1642 domain-containing protein [Listeria rocourtiae]EUJ51823.1 gp51 [Listeria rocourtiae FSL F6-920]TDR53911.1 uncharacterized protein DUF1642 [Listeria rocourtiae]